MSFTTTVTFEEIFRVILFILSVHYAGELIVVIKCPKLVGQILAGIALGPQVLGFVPFEESLVLLGEIGLIMLMFEAGIEFDLLLAKTCGLRAVLMSIIFAGLATGCGIGVGIALGTDFQGAFSIGASFAQTAIGTCMPVLQGGGLLNTPIGQMILTATAIDDMIALTLLSVMDSLGSGEKQSLFVKFVPIISSIIWLFGLGGLAIFVAPRVIDGYLLSKIRRDHQKPVLYLLMIAITLAYMPLLKYTKSSYLMGATLAGMTFSQTAMGADAFLQCRMIYDWLMKLFYAASIGFQIPVQLFGKGSVWAYGMIFIFTAVPVKAMALVFVPTFQQGDAMFNLHRRDQVVAGLSMMTRGGFGFLISASAFNSELIDVEMYASVVLAILFATILPSYAMNFAVMKFEALRQMAQQKTKEENDDKMPLFLRVDIEAKASWGLQHTIINAVSSIGLGVEDSRTYHVMGDAKRGTVFRPGQHADSKVATTLFLWDDEDRIDIEMGKELEDRLVKIRNMLVEKLCQFEPSIELSPWNPFDDFAFETLNLISILHHGQSHEEEQSAELLYALFSILDVDGALQLTREDLKTGLYNINIKLNSYQFDVLMKMLDSDDDGVVSFDDWKKTISYLKMKEKKTLRVCTDESRNIRPTYAPGLDESFQSMRMRSQRILHRSSTSQKNLQHEP